MSNTTPNTINTDTINNINTNTINTPPVSQPQSGLILTRARLLEEYEEVLLIYQDFYTILHARYERLKRGEELSTQEENDFSHENIERVLGMIADLVKKLDGLGRMIGELERMRGERR